MSENIKFELELTPSEIKWLYGIANDSFIKIIFKDIEDLNSMLSKIVTQIKPIIPDDVKLDNALFNEGLEMFLDSSEAPLLLDKYTSFLGDLSEVVQENKEKIESDLNKEINQIFNNPEA